MKKLIFKICLILFISLGPTLLQAQSVLIKVGHVIQPESGEILVDQSVLIENGVIKEILKTNSADELKYDRVIDLGNAYLMPGMMDAHVHLTYNAPVGNFNPKATYADEPTSLRALRGLKNANDLLMAGFTTVKEIGNDAEYATASIIKSINKGWFDGPTILYAGKIISQYGGQIGGMSPEREPLWEHEYIVAETSDEIRKAIHENMYYGANTIKLVADANPYFYTEEQIRAAVDEAARFDMHVAAHVDGGEAARNVILGGAKAIEHGFNLDNELLKLMVENGTYLSGTDFTQPHLEAMGMPGKWAGKLADRIVARLKNAHELGVKMVFSTDVVVDLPGMNRAESNLEFLNAWKAAEIPNEYIIKALTINNAKLFGKEDQLGKIQPGYKADLIAIPGNPFKDIDILKKVSFVMKGGKVMVHERT